MFQSFKGITTCFLHGEFGKQLSTQLAICRFSKAAVKGPQLLRIESVKWIKPAAFDRSLDRFSIGFRKADRAP